MDTFLTYAPTAIWWIGIILLGTMADKIYRGGNDDDDDMI